ncbi:MAG: putative quinol monooxygenase [Roseiarcus sp.]|jgi:quinol monooxygenase YgiN|uniref:putative quinol monooxygenase n=1 Tax=Roseiarcus sp. TaxID=1969460 RepID=UPI003BB0C0E8
MIRVVVMLAAKPGRRDELIAAFEDVAQTVRREAGCIEYAAFVDATGVGPFQAKVGPDRCIILEKWESAEALNAHVAQPHMAAYNKKTKDLIASLAIHAVTAV